MSDYQHLLIGIDLSSESTTVSEKAAAIAKAFSAKMSIIHVMEPLSFAYGGDLPLDFSGIQEEIQQQAQKQMSIVSERLGIPKDRQYLVLGKPDKEIRNTAEEIQADLIIVGSHGRHGLARLLGSTANGVLHGAKCDVLAVRVGE
jgi:universal stress protein A